MVEKIDHQTIERVGVLHLRPVAAAVEEDGAGVGDGGDEQEGLLVVRDPVVAAGDGPLCRAMEAIGLGVARTWPATRLR